MTDQQIISDWFHQYSDDVYHFFIFRIGSTDVEDLVQEVFIRAIKGIDSFQGNSQPKTWLFTIARNVAIDELRKRSRNKWKNYFFSEENHDVIVEQTPDQLFQINEETMKLYQAIQSLKENYREVVILRGIKELSEKETSLILNWSESKVRSTYHRAKKVLLKELQSELGGEYSER
ncbi:RNA polymerase [Anaerobacillus alkalidiazotrophicus]|uniref:RNA polymerase sigma factor n=1 Tax=Anaerobacillus alkalidiazotrophicus TaxID=472963 RepID=A0A1S2MC92_9BACI|nr:RNA polymerase sigma factor [Anaerobacillus alkalidiazotrophicus]OIJ22220.1 RNA polymerase [Anaerobacillus alkalidiazotrophicus]